MKTLEISKATAPLAEYAKRVRAEPMVVTLAGRPMAILLSVKNTDLETLTLNTHPKFLAIIERSKGQLKAGRGIPSEEVWHRLGVKPKSRAKRRSR